MATRHSAGPALSTNKDCEVIRKSYLWRPGQGQIIDIVCPPPLPPRPSGVYFLSRPGPDWVKQSSDQSRAQPGCHSEISRVQEVSDRQQAGLLLFSCLALSQGREEEEDAAVLCENFVPVFHMTVLRPPSQPAMMSPVSHRGVRIRENCPNIGLQLGQISLT